MCWQTLVKLDNTKFNGILLRSSRAVMRGQTDRCGEAVSVICNFFVNEPRNKPERMWLKGWRVCGSQEYYGCRRSVELTDCAGAEAEGNNGQLAAEGDAVCVENGKTGGTLASGAADLLL
jgi:hypothetical protein